MTINRILIICLIFFCFSCENRLPLITPVILSHFSDNMRTKIELVETRRIPKSNNKNDWSYFYYGTFSSSLNPNKSPREIKILYHNKESQIFLDSIGDFNFWEKGWWNSDGFRENKAYFVLDEENIDWNKVKLIESDIVKPMTHDEICKMLKENSSQNYKKLCDY